MAQADMDGKEDLGDVKDLSAAPISGNLEYYLKSVSNIKYLNSDGKLASNDSKVRWTFVPVGDNIYGLKTEHNHYLESPDSREESIYPKLIGEGDATKHISQQWRVVKVKENKVALQAVKSGLYISGRRKGETKPTMQEVGTATAKTKDRKDGKIDEYLQWWLVPNDANYTLHCYLSEFNFGDSIKVNDLVNDDPKRWGDSNVTVNVDSKAKGSKVAVDVTISPESSFSWTLAEAIGFDIAGSCTVDVPLMVPDVNDSTIVSTSFEIERNKNNVSKWEIKELKKTYTRALKFTANESGIYKVILAADETRNVSLDFEAKVKYEAKTGKDTQLGGNELEAILFYHQTAPNVYSSGTVKGTMQATYVVRITPTLKEPK